MKKYLFTLVAAFIAVVSFAQVVPVKQLANSETLKKGTVEKQLTHRISIKNIPVPVRNKVLGKKAMRRAALSSIEDLNGDFIIANEEYNVDEESKKFVPAEVAHSGNAATIEVTGENSLTSYLEKIYQNKGINFIFCPLIAIITNFSFPNISTKIYI